MIFKLHKSRVNEPLNYEQEPSDWHFWVDKGQVPCPVLSPVAVTEADVPLQAVHAPKVEHGEPTGLVPSQQTGVVDVHVVAEP